MMNCLLLVLALFVGPNKPDCAFPANPGINISTMIPATSCQYPYTMDLACKAGCLLTLLDCRTAAYVTWDQALNEAYDLYLERYALCETESCRCVWAAEAEAMIAVAQQNYNVAIAQCNSAYLDCAALCCTDGDPQAAPDCPFPASVELRVSSRITPAIECTFGHTMDYTCLTACANTLVDCKVNAFFNWSAQLQAHFNQYKALYDACPDEACRCYYAQAMLDGVSVFQNNYEMEVLGCVNDYINCAYACCEDNEQ